MDPLSRAEWSVMKTVWDRGEVIVRDVLDALAKERGWARNTVRTMLERLVAKGYLERRQIGSLDLFRAKVRRARAVKEAMRDFADRVLDGAIAPFVTYLIESRDIDPDELEALQKALSQKKRSS